jgi:hypothetical protein|tara:strand:- start:87 stop:194 length:108 start_codon:yes stop_codon:yes gene_type:complete
MVAIAGAIVMSWPPLVAPARAWDVYHMRGTLAAMP